MTFEYRGCETGRFSGLAPNRAKEDEYKAKKVRDFFWNWASKFPLEMPPVSPSVLIDCDFEFLEGYMDGSEDY